MNAVKNLVKLSLGFEQKGNGKMIGVLRKEKAAWLDKVPSGLRGKPDNNPFGQCITVYGRQTGGQLPWEKGSPNTVFNWTRTMSIGINVWKTHVCDRIFQM